MTQTEEFIVALHMIAASDSHIGRQKDAVREVLARFLREATEALGGDKQRVRAWVDGQLKLELMKQAQTPRADRFADLLDHARVLVADPPALSPVAAR